jgi:hypothetical protein
VILTESQLRDRDDAQPTLDRLAAAIAPETATDELQVELIGLAVLRARAAAEATS